MTRTERAKLIQAAEMFRRGDAWKSQEYVDWLWCYPHIDDDLLCGRLPGGTSATLECAAQIAESLAYDNTDGPR